MLIQKKPLEIGAFLFSQRRTKQEHGRGGQRREETTPLEGEREGRKRVGRESESGMRTDGSGSERERAARTCMWNYLRATCCLCLAVFKIIFKIIQIYNCRQKK